MALSTSADLQAGSASAELLWCAPLPGRVSGQLTAAQLQRSIPVPGKPLNASNTVLAMVHDGGIVALAQLS